MKTFTPAEAQSDIEGLLESAQSGKVVIVRNGKPTAVVIGLEDYDAEDAATAGSEEFWRLIRERGSAGGAATLEEVRARLGLNDAHSMESSRER